MSGNTAELFVRGCAVHIMLCVSFTILNICSADPM